MGYVIPRWALRAWHRDERERRNSVLTYDRIPIERHWEVSMLLHDALGHVDPWEICAAGCDELASDAIRALFKRAR